MEFTLTEGDNRFIKLLSSGYEYLGPSELTQYFIEDIDMYESIISSGRQSIRISIHLGRRLFGTIMTIFLPTVLLTIIGHMTNYFKAFFVNVMVVNLTVLLVLTTMFVNINSKLPTTSYIKMVDIWLIFNLIIPFTEVLLHTYKDCLTHEEKNLKAEIADLELGISQKSVWTDEPHKNAPVKQQSSTEDKVYFLRFDIQSICII